MMQVAVAALLALAQTNDKAQANGYDDAWKAAWRSHCMSVLSGGSGKVDGFVIHIGDSITFSTAYRIWMTSGTGRTNEDLGITDQWINNFPFPSGNVVTSHHGLYLACYDSPSSGRSFTAAGGIDTSEYLSGSNNGTLPAMPSTTDTATAQGYVSANYPGNLQIDTVAAAFSAAQVAVVMLGTNDCTGGRTPSAFITDLGSIVTKLEYQHIAVVLSTIPPNINNITLAPQYNDQIRSYAQTHGLPLIDFYAEILARQPVNWSGTLINSGDVHPTGSGTANGVAYDLSSSIYADGGDPNTHKTGAAATCVGYLLRSWLTAQKLKEVRSFVVQGNPAVLANPSPSPSPSPTPSPSSASSSGGGGGGGGCHATASGPASPSALLGTALAVLLLLAASRKTGI
jgi:hypothetical protein